MEFNVTREQWVDRFAMRFSQLDAGAEPGSFVALATGLWETLGQVDPETPPRASSLFDSGGTERPCAVRAHAVFTGDGRSSRPSASRSSAFMHQGEYVRDNDEWVARCVRASSSSTPSQGRRGEPLVADLAALERWRLMKPEAAASSFTPHHDKPRRRSRRRPARRRS